MSLSDWFSILCSRVQRQEGQTMAEYGVVLALITLAVVVVIATLGTTIATQLGNVVNQM
jgi:Flp pilus assembly pilin Flp